MSRWKIVYWWHFINLTESLPASNYHGVLAAFSPSIFPPSAQHLLTCCKSYFSTSQHLPVEPILFINTISRSPLDFPHICLNGKKNRLITAFTIFSPLAPDIASYHPAKGSQIITVAPWKHDNQAFMSFSRIELCDLFLSFSFVCSDG